MCYHIEAGLPRAVKIISKDLMNSQEVEILKTMDHPNIIRLYEVFSDDKYYHMVTE